MLTGLVLAAVLSPLLVLPGSASAGPPRCAVVDSIGRCLVSAVDPGRPGAGEGRRARKRTAEPPERQRTPRSTPTEDGEPEPENRATLLPIGSGWTYKDPGDLDAVLADPAARAPRAGAAPSPAVLAQRAVEQLNLPAPSVHTSGGQEAIVGVPLWLWVDRDPVYVAPASATATAGAAQVTAEARFAGIDWSMGPSGASVHCDGTGTPWSGQDGPSPDCGYTYEQRSLATRTGGTGRWPVVATAVWSVTWTGVSAGAAVTGEQEVRVPTTTSLPVGEVQVLVDGHGS